VSYCIRSNKAADLEITEMRLEDLEEVMAIERSSFMTAWSERMFMESLSLSACHNLVARTEVENGQEVVGYIEFLIVVDEVYVRNIAVREDFRMRGVASKLMVAMMKISHHRGVERATLESRKSNTSAVKLYEKFGFVVKGVRPLYYSDTGEDALIMWADLEESFKRVGV
jgi:ribosomal-protein-alanine N-acetyltransferase